MTSPGCSSGLQTSGGLIGNQPNQNLICPHHFEDECFWHDKGKSSSPRHLCLPFPSLVVFKSGHSRYRQRNRVGTEVSGNVDHVKASAAHDHTYCVSNVTSPLSLLYSMWTLQPSWSSSICVNATEKWAFTPLHEAAWKGCTQLCALLMAHEADPTMKKK